MAVARKPRPQAADPLALIEKGGSPAGARDGRRITPVALRVPSGLLARLDAARRADAVPLPRNTWILQAIALKLAKDDEG